ncbi:hypothetical protein VCUG_01650 [Vavraia culicis subsp. floridensis]|uniref:C2H2-type domain-containing protein n=1 Tax=Vavraia culicis (isolate floridensis) TaxID=948595 RepID=L2GTA9_VAVCU|nr:uncharacterized protein VCUG_01650 [Vavraia culicis subsp. floridensis]ELA46876.1 hypothetical protein VCUG_01650 [Vavraia culicis subsp. floridensis]
MASRNKHFKCIMCDKAFNRAKKLISHQNLHTQNYPFVCATCKRSYPSEKSLNYHKLTHTKPMFSCDKCQKSFFYRDKLKKHSLVCGRQWICSCGRIFIKKLWYDRHMEEHDGSEHLSKKKILEIRIKAQKYVFKCKYCKKEMKSRKTLEVHERAVHKPLR